MARIPPLTSLGKEQAVTAVAALPSHLALGTTSGVVFWHDRAANSLQRLEVFPGVEVTCLALASTTDLMLAVGSYEGQLAIYQASYQQAFSFCPAYRKLFGIWQDGFFLQIFSRTDSEANLPYGRRWTCLSRDCPRHPTFCSSKPAHKVAQKTLK